jgi:hypothetical protein
MKRHPQTCPANHAKAYRTKAACVRATGSAEHCDRCRQWHPKRKKGRRG